MPPHSHCAVPTGRDHLARDSAITHGTVTATVRSQGSPASSAISRQNIKVIGIGVGLTANHDGMKELRWLTDIVRRTDEFDEEFHRKGDFERIFPNKDNVEKYSKFFLT